MEDILEHNKLFNEIIQKYKFDHPDKAEEISKFLTDKKNQGKISYKEFAKLFLITEKEAEVFLSFIQKGIAFKESQNKFN